MGCVRYDFRHNSSLCFVFLHRCSRIIGPYNRRCWKAYAQLNTQRRPKHSCTRKECLRSCRCIRKEGLRSAEYAKKACARLYTQRGPALGCTCKEGLCTAEQETDEFAQVDSVGPENLTESNFGQIVGCSDCP